jgi:hypothetical protein
MDVEASVREDIVAEFSVKDRKSAFHLILGSMPPGLRFPNCGTPPGGRRWSSCEARVVCMRDTFILKEIWT